MDLLGYAALGGLERLTIVAGAVIIGYWGYRLYTAEKSAGLVFMGLAVLVLAAALATGGSHLRSIGEGYQLASLPAAAPDMEAATPPGAPAGASRAPSATGADDASQPASAGPETPAVPSDLPAASPAPVADAPAPGTPAAASAAVTDPESGPSAAIPAEDAGTDTDTDELVSPVRLATGQELGGRIVSVKSENVSLEWAEESE